MPPPKNLGELLDVRAALFTPPEKADLDDVVQHFFQIAGGSKAVAQLFWNELSNEETPAPVRARIMEMVMRTFTKLEAQATPLEDMNDADLEREFDERLKKLANANGNPETRTAGQGAGAEGPQEGAAQAADNPTADDGSGRGAQPEFWADSI